MDVGMVLFCFFSIALGFIIKGLVGFGDPLVYTPLLSVALPNSTITPGMLPVSLVLNARVVWQNRDHFSPRLVLPIAAFVMLGIIPGTLLLRYGSPTVLKLLLGLVIIAMGVEMLTRKPGTGRPSALLRSVMSFLSGVTAGLFGIDLLFLAYLERVTQNREEEPMEVEFVFSDEGIDPIRAEGQAAPGVPNLYSAVLTIPLDHCISGTGTLSVVFRQGGAEYLQPLAESLGIFPDTVDFDPVLERE